MRVIHAGVAQGIPKEYAVRLIEQGKAIPAPPSPPAPISELAPKAKGKRKDEEVNAHEPEKKD